MSEKIVKIYDAQSGETLEREMTQEELDFLDQVAEEDKARKEAQEATKASALSKLAALGLTEEEIAAL